MTVYFYTKNEPNFELSNFAPYGISVDDLWWSTVEHYFQAQKFGDAGHRERIRKAFMPKQAAALGRSREFPIRSDWETAKDGIMLKAVLLKFQTHPEIRRRLIATGDEEIIETSPGDYYWGAGADGSGRNRLGEILMEVRRRILAGDTDS